MRRIERSSAKPTSAEGVTSAPKKTISARGGRSLAWKPCVKKNACVEALRERVCGDSESSRRQAHRHVEHAAPLCGGNQGDSSFRVVPVLSAVEHLLGHRAVAAVEAGACHP